MINNQMRLSGFASGLDTTSIIRDLMKAERMPMDRIYQKKEWLQWQRDAYRDVNLEVNTFKSRVDKLRYEYNFNGYKATSSSTENALVSSKSNAIQGSYELKIEQLAEVAKIKSGSVIKVNDPTPENPINNRAAKATDKVLTEGQGDSTFEVTTKNGKATITVNEKDTFASLASKIGSATDSSGKSLGLRASFDETTSSFVLSTKDMGGDQMIELTHGTGNTNVASLIFNGSTGTESTFKGEGKYAKITFDGTEIDNLSSNKVSVYGVDLTLLKAGTTTTIKVESDTESIFNNIKDFVDSYNALIDSLNSKMKTTRNRDFQPLTEEEREGLSDKEAEKWDEKAKQGLLYNDSILRETLTSLRGSMYTPVKGIPDGQMKLLSELGIQSPYMSKDGKLEINEEKLKAAIANNPDEVSQLFTATDGIASRVYNQMDKAVNNLNKKAGRPETNPNLDSSTLGASIADLNKQMKTWEDKLFKIENRYWKQFTAMEKAISKMNEQSNSILGMSGQ